MKNIYIIIILAAAVSIGVNILWNVKVPSVQPVEEEKTEENLGQGRADLTTCTGSTTLTRLPANTMTLVVATNTRRQSVDVEATSTPGSTSFYVSPYGGPRPSIGQHMIQTASSSIDLIGERNLQTGPIYARSQDSAAQITVTECNH